MCGRYITPDERALEDFYFLGRKNWRSPFEGVNYNTPPTTQIPLIYRAPDGVIELAGMRWGLIPFFAKGVPPKVPMHIARWDRLKTAPSYRGPWKRGQRCIFPMHGFYEWRLMPDGKTKQPYYITIGDQATFGVAGIWEASVAADGTTVHSAALITIDANAMMQRYSNDKRMPAILKREALEAWLTGSPEEAQRCIVPYDDELMIAWPVSKAVGNSRNRSKECIEPVQVEE